MYFKKQTRIENFGYTSYLYMCVYVLTVISNMPKSMQSYIFCDNNTNTGGKQAEKKACEN